MVQKSAKHSNFFLVTAFIFLSFLVCCQSDKVENLGIFGANRQQSILGQDGCTPIPLGNIMMWTFGDTILGTWKGELSVNTTFEESAVMNNMISNSLAFTEIPDDTNFTKLNFEFYKQNGKVATFIKNYPGEDTREWRFWPVDGIQIDSTVYVYYYIIFVDRNINGKNKNLFPFKVKGTGIAEWVKPASWKVGDPVYFKRSPKIFSETEPVFGDCIERLGDTLYVIGHGRPVKSMVPVYIARVKTSEIKNRLAYNFLDEQNRWSPDIKRARAFFYDAMGELSFTFNDYLKKFIIIYCSMDGKIKYVDFKDFSFLPNKIAKIVYVPPVLPKIESRPHLYYYSGKEIFHTRKGIYAIYIHPAIYQPILIRIPYSAMPD